MKKVFVATTTFALCLGSAAHASQVTYTYEWTAADLINNQFANGADGSSAADTGLHDGARLLRDGMSPTSENAARTYVESEQANFTQRWNDMAEEGYVLDQFNLWGFDGNGANWGEDYKPYEWVNVTAPDGWTTQMQENPWIHLYPEHHTDVMPYFYTDQGIALDASQSYLESLEFSATITFDTEDAFWGQDVGDAPNELDEGFTAWFGSYLRLYDEEGVEIDSHIYEGNMYMAVIPLPAPVFMGLAGLLGVAALRRRRVI